MRILMLFVITAVFLGWQMLPSASPARSGLAPVSVSQRISDNALLLRARDAGLLVEDAHRHALRQAALDAGRQLEGTPCDAGAQQQLRHALDALLAELHDTMDKPLETIAVDGRVIDASPVLNETARQVWQNADAAGILREDAGAMTATHVARGEGSGPYACRIG